MTEGSGLAAIGRVPAGVDRDDAVAHLQRAAREIRLRDLQMVTSAGLGHVGGEMSVVDILATLYLAVLDIDPDRLDDPERDRLVLSKGHAAAALYATLATAGLLGEDRLADFLVEGSDLNGHPASTKLAAVEASTGPLGHGLPIAVGMALAARLDGSSRRTYVIAGDGEMQEGSNWEALMIAAHHGLDRLCLVIDRNGLQQGAAVAETNDLEPLADKLRAFGWSVIEVDGHAHADLLDALGPIPHRPGSPTAVIAATHKGHPISFMADDPAWHHRVPTADEARAAAAEVAAT